jgi:gas vesicle protein
MTQVNTFLIGVVLGLLIGVVAIKIAYTPTKEWQEQAIKHKVGTFDNKGNFKWLPQTSENTIIIL